jgi:hypothetical protein
MGCDLTVLITILGMPEDMAVIKTIASCTGRDLDGGPRFWAPNIAISDVARWTLKSSCV